MDAPGTASPLASFTVPVICAVEPCAHTAAQVSNEAKIKRARLLDFVMKAPLTGAKYISANARIQGSYPQEAVKRGCLRQRDNLRLTAAGARFRAFFCRRGTPGRASL